MDSQLTGTDVEDSYIHIYICMHVWSDFIDKEDFLGEGF